MKNTVWLSRQREVTLPELKRQLRESDVCTSSIRLAIAADNEGYPVMRKDVHGGTGETVITELNSYILSSAVRFDQEMRGNPELNDPCNPLDAKPHIVEKLEEAWKLLSDSLIGMNTKDPRYDPTIEWLNKNRCYQKQK